MSQERRAWFARRAPLELVAWIAQAVVLRAPTEAFWAEMFLMERAVKQQERQKQRAWMGLWAVEQAALQLVSPGDELAPVGSLPEHLSWESPEAASLFALAAPLAPAQPIHQKIYDEKVLAGSD